MNFAQILCRYTNAIQRQSQSHQMICLSYFIFIHISTHLKIWQNMVKFLFSVLKTNPNGHFFPSRTMDLTQQFGMLQYLVLFQISLVSNRGHNIKFIPQQCRIPMNPSQSESFWKGQMRDDMQLRRAPRESRPPNRPITRRTYIMHKSASQICTQPSSQLQQQPMKKLPFQWGEAQEQQLFALQQQMGNRWSAIAVRLGADDNSVKNKFYSTLRRGLRKLNKYIEIVRRGRSAAHLAANKYLKAEMLVKVNAVVDKTHEEKYQVRQRAIDVAEDIQRKLIELVRTDAAYQKNLEGGYEFEERLLGLIGDFNRNCKRRKGKRKVKQESSENESGSEGKEQVVHLEPQNKVTNSTQITANNHIDKTAQIRQSILLKSNYKNEEGKQDEAIRIEQIKQSMFMQQRQGECNGSVLEGKESITYSGFDGGLDSQQYRNILHSNKLLISRTPVCSFPDHFSELVKKMHLSTSYNLNSMKESTDMSKPLLERIPSLAKKYNPEHALFKSSDIRQQIYNFQGKGLTQANHKEGENQNE